MRKLIALALTLVLALTLFACGEGGGGKSGGIYFDDESINVLVGRTDYYVVVKTEENFSGDTDKMTWSSSDESVCTVTDSTMANLISGRLNPKKSGTVTIKATASNGKSASITVNVFATLRARQTTVSVTQGETVAFPLNDYTGVSFVSANTAIATVASDGTITGVAAGETTITASNAMTSCTVAVKVKKVTLPVTTFVMSVVKGEMVAFPLSNVTGVTFTSADKSIVLVNENGIMTGNAKGDTTVTATKGGVSATITVGVVESEEKTVTLAEEADERFNFYGRTKFQGTDIGQAFYYTASGFDVTFYGTQLKADLYDGKSGDTVSLSVFVDDETMISASATGNRVINLSGSKQYTLVSGLTEGWHTVKVRKRTPYYSGTTKHGYFGLKSLTTDGYICYTPNKSDVRIDFYGDSITSGYGNLTDGKSENSTTTDGNMTYATILANKLGYDYNVVSASGWGVAWRGNGDPLSLPEQYDKLCLYDDKSTGYASGADIIVINLGTNDASGQNEKNNNITEFKTKYTTFLTNLLNANPDAYIVCSYGMMGTNATIMNTIQEVVNANNSNRIYVLNFTNTGNGAHPLIVGHMTSAAELEAHLKSNGII